MTRCANCNSKDAKYEHGGSLLCDDCIQEVTIPASVYSRIVGYMRPVDAWNKGKRQEFADRVVYRVPNELPEAKRRPLLTTPFEVVE